MNWSLTQFPPLVRMILALFLLLNATAYSTAIFLVDHTTDLKVEGIADQYAGNEEQVAAGVEVTEFKFPVSKTHLLTTVHSHIFGMSMSFLLVGLIFSATGFPDRLKRFVIMEVMISILTTFAGLWLTVFVHRGFAWLVFLSSTFMAMGYYGSVVLSLYDLFKIHRVERKTALL